MNQEIFSSDIWNLSYFSNSKGNKLKISMKKDKKNS